MPTTIHSFSPEEMMAFLDGELTGERAVATARHLEQCRECQRMAAELASVSRELRAWQVEPSVAEAPELATPGKEERAVRSERRAWVLAGSAVAALVVVVAVALQFEAGKPKMSPGAVALTEEKRGAARGLFEREGAGVSGAMMGQQAVPMHQMLLPPQPAPAKATAAPFTPASSAGPLIVRTAQLTVVSKNFEESQSRVESVAKANGGYISELQLESPHGAGRTLNATLRVPAGQLDGALRDLRRLGHVEEESQGGEDVTRQTADVDARLANLRTTEERLLQMLRERTGRLADVLQVEEAVDRTRGEIEAAEAEQKTLAGQVALARVTLRVTEEYRAAVEDSAPSLGVRLRNAAVAGYRNLVGAAVWVSEILLAVGPVMLVGLALLFYPVRWFWRRRGRAA